MSLVVARRIGTSIGIVGDTAITPYADKASWREGRLKTAIANEKLCVSFAGDPEYADAALRSLDPKRHSDSRGVVEHFLHWHLTGNQRTDFLLAFGPPDTRVTEIKNGEARDTAHAWIGSPPAFDRFQSYMLEPDRLHRSVQPPSDALIVAFRVMHSPKDDEEAGHDLMRLKEAMAGVTADSDIEEVGGIVTPVCYEAESFKYMDYVDFFTHAIPRGNIPAQMTTIHAGTAAQGGYSSNFMNGQGSNGSNVAAVYFQQGNFGIVYLSEGGGFPRPHVIENVSAVDFVDRARERYGVVLNCRLATSAGYYNRGVLRDTKDERDDANADYTQAIEKDGTNAHAYHNRGANGLRAGQFDSAIADLTKAIELKQDYDLAYSNRALAHKKKGMVDAALDDYTKAIAVNPASAELYFFRGVLLDELDRREEAIADYTKMIELNPGHAKAYNNRGRLYLELGLREKALSDLQQAAEVDPTDPDYRQNLMVVLASSLAGYGPSY